jgi:hypothetical protein
MYGQDLTHHSSVQNLFLLYCKSGSIWYLGRFSSIVLCFADDWGKADIAVVFKVAQVTCHRYELCWSYSIAFTRYISQVALIGAGKNNSVYNVHEVSALRCTGFGQTWRR